jgi:hypothetical protein
MDFIAVQFSKIANRDCQRTPYVWQSLPIGVRNYFEDNHFRPKYENEFWC